MLHILLLTAALASGAEPQEAERDNEKPAEESAQPTEPLTYQEVVVVTATKTEERLVESVSMVSAFTEQELQSSPAIVIDDELRRIPGFSLFRRSSSLYSHPTTQGVSLRGIGPSGASRSLVLWNGIPLNDPFGNWVYWNRLPTLSLRSAEVARGATSQLYGSSALSGTIQLLPRPVQNSTFDMRLQAGNLSTYDLDLFASDQVGDWGWLLSGRVFDTDGYIQIREQERGPVDVPTNAAFQTFVGRLEHRDFHVGVNLFNEQRSNGTPIQQNDSSIYLVEAGYEAERWSLNVFGQSQELNSQFSRILPGRTGEVQTADQHFPSTGFGAAFTMYSDVGLQWGIDWRRAAWNDKENATTYDQNFTGAFLQYLVTFGERLDVLLGGRVDLWENQSTQTSFNPRAGVVYRASSAFTLRGSTYRGFRAPTLNELYRPFRVGNALTEANPDLTEEWLWGVEGGVDIHPSRQLLLRLNGFYNSLQNPVSNRTIGREGNLILRQRANLGSATTKGFETELDLRIADDWVARVSYLFSRSVDDDTDLFLPQSPEHQGLLGLSYEGRPLRVSADLRIVGDAYDDDLNTLLLPSYEVLDVSVRAPISRRLDLYLALENVTDSEYLVRFTPEGNLGVPRTVHGGVQVRVFD